MEKALSVLQSTLVLCLFMAILLLGKLNKAPHSAAPPTPLPLSTAKWEGGEITDPAKEIREYSFSYKATPIFFTLANNAAYPKNELDQEKQFALFLHHHVLFHNSSPFLNNGGAFLGNEFSLNRPYFCQDQYSTGSNCN